MAIADGHLCEDDMRAGIGNCNNCCNTFTINDCRAGTGADYLQAFANREMLTVGRSRDPNRITRRSEWDGMSDGLAGGRG